MPLDIFKREVPESPFVREAGGLFVGGLHGVGNLATVVSTAFEEAFPNAAKLDQEVQLVIWIEESRRQWVGEPPMPIAKNFFWEEAVQFLSDLGNDPCPDILAIEVRFSPGVSVSKEKHTHWVVEADKRYRESIPDLPRHQREVRV